MKKMVKLCSFITVLCMLLLTAAGCKSGSQKTTAGVSTATKPKSTSSQTVGSTQKTAMKTSTMIKTGSDAGEWPENSQNEEEKTSEESQNGEEAAPDEEVIDLGGKRIILYLSKAIPTVQEPDPKEGTHLLLGTSQAHDALYYSLKLAEKKYNCIFECYDDSNNTETLIPAQLAGIKLCDAMETTGNRVFPDMVLNKIIMPVDDYVDFESPLWSPTGLSTASLLLGKHWGLCGFPSVQGEIGSCIVYNSDLLNRIGAQDPQELMNQDRWNWDTYLEIARLATQDLNGDGIIDQWGITGANDRFVFSLLFSNGARFTEYIDGRVKTSLFDRNAVNAVQFGLDLCSVYKVVEPLTFYSRNFPKRLDVYLAGNAAMLATEGYDLGVTLGSGITGSRIAMLPKGPDTNSYHNVMATSTLLIFPAILETEEDGGNIIKAIADASCYWDKRKPFWNDGSLKEYTTLPTGTERDQAIINTYKPQVFYPNEPTSYYGNYVYTARMIFYNAGGLGSALESIRTSMQELLDKTYRVNQ